MSPHAFSPDPFACPFAPVHAACSAQRPPPAACSREVSGAYKSSIGTAFHTAASGGDTSHALQALTQLVLEYVRSLTSKYTTLRDSRTQQAGTRDRDSKHLLLQQELALLHEIIDIQHDMRKLHGQYAASDVVARSSQAICNALMPLR
jgi:cell shape-determining protein MreC